MMKIIPHYHMMEISWREDMKFARVFPHPVIGMSIEAPGRLLVRCSQLYTANPDETLMHVQVIDLNGVGIPASCEYTVAPGTLIEVATAQEGK